MGSLLLSAGAKGKRFSLPNSRIMIHQPSGGTQGQVTDIEIQAREISGRARASTKLCPPYGAIARNDRRRGRAR